MTEKNMTEIRNEANEAEIVKPVRCEIFRDNFENSRSYNIPRAQMIIADIPYNISFDFHASRPDWYKDGRIENGESDLARKAAFSRDVDSFNINNFFAFTTRLLRPEPPKGEKGAPCLLIFCSFEELHEVIEQGQKHGFKHYTPLVFIKNYSASILKANQKVVTGCEFGALLYRNKLPKFNNLDESGKRRMIKNWFEFRRDGKDIPKIHPTQKPVNLLKQLITIFTDPGDVVIDPCCGSGSTLFAARELGRSSFGFEVSKEFYTKAKTEMLGI